MNPLECKLKALSGRAHPVLDPIFSRDAYIAVDLSESNTALLGMAIDDPRICQAYIDIQLKERGGSIAYGGYLEQRNLYNTHSHFALQKRNIHLGIDLWASAGTRVMAPLDGRVHSFGNNKGKGDYGPTLILLHQGTDFRFHTLYGHLDLESLHGLRQGQAIDAGTGIGHLGTPDVNGGYAPHLHFQIVENMEGYMGDYPGVCALETLDSYAANCPNPSFLLGLQP